MRLLHLTDRLSARGGADLHLLGVLADLAPHHEVTLGIGRSDASALAPCPTVTVAGLAAPGRAPVAAQLEALRGRLRPDGIHLHNVMNPEALAWGADHGALMTVQDHRSFCPGQGKLTLAGEVCRTPMSPEVCAPCFADPAYFAAILALTEERSAQLRRLRALTVLSAYMKEELTAVGIPADRIHVIPPFVYDLDPGAPEAPRATHLLFAGRLTRTKGVDDAVEAWGRSGLDLPLWFAGSGPERGRLEAAGHRVLGWVPHRDLGPLLATAAALLMPSRWQEPFGIVGLEAVSLGVPVVAYDSGGIRAWHPGPGLVPWGDVEALGAALAELARGPRPGPRTPGPDRRALGRELEGLYDALRDPPGERGLPSGLTGR